MLRKVIKYIDFNGNEREDTFYFNLTRAELMEVELDTKDSFSSTLEDVAKETDPRKVLNSFKKIIAKSYGEKSEDGRRFYKSSELSSAFMATEAYSELLVELATNADAAAEFVDGIVPKKAVKEEGSAIKVVAEDK